MYYYLLIFSFIRSDNKKKHAMPLKCGGKWGNWVDKYINNKKNNFSYTSGGIQAYVPAADILVVLYTSRASPKSVILRVLSSKLSSESIVSLSKTVKEKKTN